MTIGVLFYKNPIAALYSLNFIIVPCILYSGYFKLVSTMNSFMALVSYVSFMKPTVNALLIAIYGMGRCLAEREQDIEMMATENSTMLAEEAAAWPLGNETSTMATMIVRERPEWINAMATLIDYQLDMQVANNNSQFAQQLANYSEPEDKLIHFMGLMVADGQSSMEADKAIVLEHFSLHDGYDDYWHQIYALLIYIGVFAVILFATIQMKIKRRK